MKAGWERPNWFAPSGVAPADAYSMGRQNWFPHVGGEHRAVREGAGLFDQSSFAKYEMRGPGAAAALDWIIANRVPKPGRLAYTQMLNSRGGIECDLTLTRTAPDTWYVVTGAAFGAHDMGWIRNNSPHDGSVVIRDLTSARSVLNLCGPKSRLVLEAVCEDDVSNEAFPYATARELTIGAAPVLALRIGYTGELGWELHVPTEYAAHVYDTLWQAGQQHGIRNIGYRAIDTMRMEKGYLYWSTDITPDTTPWEAGLAWRVSKTKEHFLGREALMASRQPARRLCTFTLERMAYPVSGEAIIADGKVDDFYKDCLTVLRRTLSKEFSALNPVFDAAMKHGRLRFGNAEIFPRSDSVKPLFRAVKSGRGFFNLPDMDFGRKDAAFVPFFGVPAATLLAPSRLAHMLHMVVQPVIAETLPGGRGWRIHFRPALAGFPTSDAEADTAVLNRYIESEILKRPAQYLWVHKRFKTRPQGEPRMY